MACHCPTCDPDHPRPDAVEFARVHTAIGPVTLTSRLTDGRVMCQLCFSYFWFCALHETEPGVREDVCAPCARLDHDQVVGCATALKGEFAKGGVDVTFATAPPASPGPDAIPPMTCPHGYTYWLEATREQLAIWAREETAEES